MSSSNHLFPNRGTRGETNLVQDLIEESIKMYGQEMFYIPRSLVAPDKILGEDRLSKFKGAYKIVCYLDQVDNYGGGGAFLQKFGYFVTEQATFTVGRREWEKSVGRYGVTILPNRPCEGDLIWFAMTDSLFEIKYVDHQSEGAGGFYQLGKLYTYKLKCELFSFSSEKFETGIDEVDNYALDASFDLLTGPKIDSETGLPVVSEDGASEIMKETEDKKEQLWDKSNALKEAAEPIIDDIEKNPFADF